MRKLDVLVTCYDEGVDVVKPLLDSIALQRGIDFNDVGVIVCCDGGDTVLTDEFLSQYPYHTEFHMCEHEGVSATRNKCLDLSDAEYVSWSDCDDLYCDTCGLYIILHEIDNGGFDALISSFREETMDNDGNIRYINHPAFPGNQFQPPQFDRTFIHGKTYRRQYLLDNDIRSNPRLWPHEDSFLNCLAIDCASPDRVKICPQIYYQWCWRGASTCRHDPKYYILKSYNCMLDSSDALVDEFTRRMMPEKAAQYSVMMTFDAYYVMNKAEWRDQENQEYRDAVERRFAAYHRKHKSMWDKMDEHQKAMISNGVRQRSVMEGMLMEALTIDQWLDRILELYPE